jgi:hypothetical protein
MLSYAEHDLSKSCCKVKSNQKKCYIIPTSIGSRYWKKEISERFGISLKSLCSGDLFKRFITLNFLLQGGAAGAVSRITGTLGKGLAALTLDDEYQKKRREAMNKRPANVGEGFARGGKGLVMVRMSLIHL